MIHCVCRQELSLGICQRFIPCEARVHPLVFLIQRQELPKAQVGLLDVSLVASRMRGMPSHLRTPDLLRKVFQRV
jgi:hypothetical protein